MVTRTAFLLFEIALIICSKGPKKSEDHSNGMWNIIECLLRVLVMNHTNTFISNDILQRKWNVTVNVSFLQLLPICRSCHPGHNVCVCVCVYWDTKVRHKVALQQVKKVGKYFSNNWLNNYYLKEHEYMKSYKFSKRAVMFSVIITTVNISRFLTAMGFWNFTKAAAHLLFVDHW